MKYFTYSTPSFPYCITTLLLSQSMKLVTINEPILTPYHSFFFQTLPLTSFFCSRILSTHHVLFDSSWQCQLHILPLFLMTWTVFRNTGEVFCTMSPSWHLPDVFLRIRMGLCILVNHIRLCILVNHIIKMPFSSH